MRWIETFLVGCCAVLSFSCAEVGQHLAETETDPDDDLIQAPEPLVCNGRCVAQPPATYTGPSLFWLGPPSVVPACPVETPYQGIQGFLDNPLVPTFARECLITPSDSCDDEGETCAPGPPEDYHVCIHHNGDDPCPGSFYSLPNTLFAMGSSATVTLCCLETGAL